ncbi:hypothetical protein D3C87_704390 [compost metagenome]
MEGALPLPIKRENMNKRNFKINKGQYLADVFDMLPSNSIIRKNVTGIGATTLEINSPRNSIIVLPNLPVIYQKSATHSGVLGVHGDVTILDIIIYVSDTRLKHKKILTTPESFYKVIEAFMNQNIDFKKEYFLLFDECDKICKDFSFRTKITLPMNHFFGFKNKAFISATALVPRDPRFESQSFELVNIEPNYKIATDINLYKTNNTNYTFNYLVRKNLRKRTYFIFCNSINLITHIINSKGIGSESSIFCGETSAEKIKRSVFKHVGYKLDESKFSTYNFMTSRFYSALDINFDKDVDIIIISDLGIAEHTIVDPATDAIQIIGRFRNPKIKKRVSIIATEDPNLKSFSEETCLKIIDTNKSTYDTIKAFADTLSSEETKQVIEELNELLDYNRFLYKNGSLNYFAIDNYIYQHNVNGLYKDFSNLKSKYESIQISNTDLKFFNIKEYGEINSKIASSSEKLLVIRGKRFKTIVHEVIRILDSLKSTNQYDINGYEEVKADLKKVHYEIVNAYDLLDHNILRLVENQFELKREMLKSINSKLTSNFPFLKDLQIAFLLGEKLSYDEIISRFGTCIEKHNLAIKPTLKNLRMFILLKRCPMPKMRWGYRIAEYINHN